MLETLTSSDSSHMMASDHFAGKHYIYTTGRFCKCLFCRICKTFFVLSLLNSWARREKQMVGRKCLTGWNFQRQQETDASGVMTTK